MTLLFMIMWILNKSLTCWPRATRTPAAAQETDLHKQWGRLTRSFDFEVIYISTQIEPMKFVAENSIMPNLNANRKNCSVEDLCTVEDISFLGGQGSLAGFMPSALNLFQ